MEHEGTRRERGEREARKNMRRGRAWKEKRREVSGEGLEGRKN